MLEKHRLDVDGRKSSTLEVRRFLHLDRGFVKSWALGFTDMEGNSWVCSSREEEGACLMGCCFSRISHHRGSEGRGGTGYGHPIGTVSVAFGYEVPAMRHLMVCVGWTMAGCSCPRTPVSLSVCLSLR